MTDIEERGRYPVQRFWSKVKQPLELKKCWEWVGARTSAGYGHFWIKPTQTLAHRFAYEQLVGPIPEGLTLDHLCRNKLCVNPTHLEPVSQKENIMRANGACALNAKKTHCKNGHALEGDNLDRYGLKLGWRWCKTCRNTWQRKYWHKSVS